MTSPIALAAPVEVGIRLIAAARARRRSLCGKSRMTWSFVYAWIVVMKPCSIPNASCSTFAIGATQFVVQEAFEMMWCCCRVVLVVVDAEHERDVRLLGRRRDQHLLRARVEVLLRAVALGEVARRLDHDVDAEVAPRQGRRVALGEHLELRAAGLDHAVAELDTLRKRPEHRVVLEQVRHRLRVGEVVHRHDLEVAVPLEVRPEEVAPDAPEPVDSHARCHLFSAS